MKKTQGIRTGDKYGRLTILQSKGRTKQYDSLWQCMCDCGNVIITRGGALKAGHTKSCGCYQKERTASAHKTHGLSSVINGEADNLYKVWVSMKGRCLNPKDMGYKNYGGRGIIICSEWLSFTPFYAWAIKSGYEKSLTLDRINNNGNYEPSNCRWATRLEQSRNRRSVKVITYNGLTRPSFEWARELGIPSKLFTERLRRGWTIEKAFNTKYIPNTTRHENNLLKKHCA